MSARAMAWAWSKIAAGRTTGPAAALVLLRLADRADPEGKCWPGHQRTAADLNLAESTVRSAVQALAGAGLLSVQRREIEGRSASNIYFLAVDNSPEDEENRVPKSGTRPPNKPDNRVPDFGTESLREKKNLPEKREGARRARPSGASPRAPRSHRGKIVFNEKTGLHHQPENERDEKAMARILEFPLGKVKQAVAHAAKLDPDGRAFPAATLRLLLRGGGGWDEVPAWARTEDANASGVDEIEGVMKWTD